MSDLIKDLLEVGKEAWKTVKHRFKLSTLFDAFTEQVIPAFVSEDQLKEFYARRMKELNEFIYNL
ncbi:MAG: hypothetical protein Kow0069_33450 [Promethearchaeota archaeon]